MTEQRLRSSPGRAAAKESRMRMHMRRFVPVLMISMLGAVGVPAHGHHALVCVPTVAQTEAKCLFDIWGYVYDLDGEPFPGIRVGDGGQSDITDSNGFYAIHELGFDTYRVTASKVGCSSGVKTVQITIFTVLQEDGNRTDFHMPCRFGD